MKEVASLIPYVTLWRGQGKTSSILFLFHEWNYCVYMLNPSAVISNCAPLYRSLPRFEVPLKAIFFRMLNLPCSLLHRRISLKNLAIFSNFTINVMFTRFLFVSDFVRSRKTTISFVISVSPSVRPCVCMEHLGSHWTNYHEFCYFNLFF